MKKILTKLDVYYTVALFSSVTGIVMVFGMLPCFFYCLAEIPLCLLLGLLVSIIPYLLIGTLHRMEEGKKKMIFTIIMMAIRFLLIGTTITLTAIFYYKGYKIFNVFAVLGGYMLTMLWLVGVSLFNKKV